MGYTTKRVEQPEDCVGYAALDPLGQKIGTVEKLFVNGHGEPKYLKVGVGGPFAKRSVLIPVQSIVVNREGGNPGTLVGAGLTSL